MATRPLLPDRSFKPCSPTAANPRFYGCFTGNSPYRHTVASLVKAGATIHSDSTALNYWNNGVPLTANKINADGDGATTMWISAAADPSYRVTCRVYKPGHCNAATTETGLRVHIPAGASATPDSDHHLFVFDSASAQEIDMWGGGGDGDGGATATINGFTMPVACQIGTYTAGELTCSWGGVFPFSGNALATVAGDSGIAGDVAYGMAALTAADILSGHIGHALGLIEPCLDDNGQYPSTPGRRSDATCKGNAANGGDGAEPTLRYGDMIHLKASVDLQAEPYSHYSTYCRIIIRALQEYGAYADDNSNGYGLHFMIVDQTNTGWQTIMASMISGGDASGSATHAAWYSCLNHIRGSDLETVTLNQGNGTIIGGNAALPPSLSP